MRCIALRRCCRAAGSGLQPPQRLHRLEGAWIAQHCCALRSELSASEMSLLALLCARASCRTQTLVRVQASSTALSRVGLGVCREGGGAGAEGRARSGLGARRGPVPSLVYMSSALPALGKHSTRHLRASALPPLIAARARQAPLSGRAGPLPEHLSTYYPCVSSAAFLRSAGRRLEWLHHPGTHTKPNKGAAHASAMLTWQNRGVLSRPRALVCCAPGSLAGGAAQGEAREPLVEVVCVRGRGGAGVHRARRANRHCLRLLGQKQGCETGSAALSLQVLQEGRLRFAASVLDAAVTA
jgi:hypothetical protein